MSHAGVPYRVVNSQPLVPIDFVDYPDESDPGPVPFPTDVPIEGTYLNCPPTTCYGDRHVLVLVSLACANAHTRIDMHTHARGHTHTHIHTRYGSPLYRFVLCVGQLYMPTVRDVLHHPATVGRHTASVRGGREWALGCEQHGTMEPDHCKA